MTCDQHAPVLDSARGETYCPRCGEVLEDRVLANLAASVFDDKPDSRQNGPAYRPGAGVPGTTFWPGDRDAHGNRIDKSPQQRLRALQMKRVHTRAIKEKTRSEGQ